MTEEKRKELEGKGWGNELEQCCGVERAQARKAVSILRHLLLALWAFLRLEAYRLRTSVSWYEAKAAILREAIRCYLAHPLRRGAQKFGWVIFDLGPQSSTRVG
jgi:hypothetical protein